MNTFEFLLSIFQYFLVFIAASHLRCRFKSWTSILLLIAVSIVISEVIFELIIGPKNATILEVIIYVSAAWAISLVWSYFKSPLSSLRVFKVEARKEIRWAFMKAGWTMKLARENPNMQSKEIKSRVSKMQEVVVGAEERFKEEIKDVFLSRDEDQHKAFFLSMEDLYEVPKYEAEALRGNWIETHKRLLRTMESDEDMTKKEADEILSEMSEKIFETIVGSRGSITFDYFKRKDPPFYEEVMQKMDELAGKTKE